MLRRTVFVMLLLGGMVASVSTTDVRAGTNDAWQSAVIANDGWRVEVVAAAQGVSISDANLDRLPDGEWLLVVADVTNWTSTDGMLPLDEVTLVSAGGVAAGATGTVLTDLNLREGPALDALILTGMPAGSTVEVTGEAENGFYPVVYNDLEGFGSVDGISVDGDVASAGGSIDSAASEQSAAALDADDGTGTISTDQTVRVTLAFQVAAGAQNPSLSFGTSLPLGDALAADVDLANLGEVTGPDLQEVGVGEVSDDGTVTLDDGTEVELAGVETPEDGACYHGEAIDELDDLTGGTVTLERATGSGDDPVIGYLWREDDGERTSINHELIAGGFAAASFDGQDDTRYQPWFDATRQQAEDDETGLWGECTGFNGDERPDPTVAPTPTPGAAEVRAEYPVIPDVRELAIRPGNFIGEQVAFSGEIFNIQVAPPGFVFFFGEDQSIEATASIQVYVVGPDGVQQPILIAYNGDTTGMFEGTFVTVYGTVEGVESFTNAFGAQISNPLVIADIIDLA